MSIRLGASLATLVILAACSQGSAGYTPAATSAAPGLRASTAGPTFSLAIVLPNGLHAHTTNVGSMKAVSKVKARTFVYLIKTAPLCPISEYKGSVSGCEILATNTTSYDVKEAVFEFYSKPDAKGCVLAKATYKGDIASGWYINTLKAENTKSCW